MNCREVKPQVVEMRSVYSQSIYVGDGVYLVTGIHLLNNQFGKEFEAVVCIVANGEEVVLSPATWNVLTEEGRYKIDIFFAGEASNLSDVKLVKHELLTSTVKRELVIKSHASWQTVRITSAVYAEMVRCSSLINIWTHRNQCSVMDATMKFVEIFKELKNGDEPPEIRTRKYLNMAYEKHDDLAIEILTVYFNELVHMINR